MTSLAWWLVLRPTWALSMCLCRGLLWFRADYGQAYFDWHRAHTVRLAVAKIGRGGT